MASSYVLLAVNTGYTLVSVPLALHYLSKEEFGIWALGLSIAGYLAMVDFGMGSSLSRLLIDHKDHRDTGEYGGMVRAGMQVGLVQAVLILVIGLVVCVFGSWFEIPGALLWEFHLLLAGQSVLVALGFATRIFGLILQAWQRTDLLNYFQILNLVVSMAVLWTGFHLRWGALSLVVANLSGFLVATVGMFVSCGRMGFWPSALERQRSLYSRFWEMFRYGADIFLVTVGSQLITSSQVILVAKGLGLEAAAVWSVTTRGFNLVCQLVWRVWGNSIPVLSEMHVRGESERLQRRYGTLVVTASVGAVAAAVLFAALNGSFVQVWTGGRIAWSGINNWLLAIWLLLLTQMGCHNSLLISLKEIRALKFIYLLEGVTFVVLGWWALKQWGFTGMLVVSIGCTALFTWSYGTCRAARLITTAPPRVAWLWQRSSLALAVVLVPCALGLQRLVADHGPVIQLVVLGVALSVLAVGLMWAVFLPRELVIEVISRLHGRRAG